MKVKTEKEEEEEKKTEANMNDYFSKIFHMLWITFLKDCYFVTVNTA